MASLVIDLWDKEKMEEDPKMVEDDQPEVEEEVPTKGDQELLN